MDVLLLIARLALAGAFAVAAIAKAADPAGSRKAMVGFGVPERLAAPAGWSLAIVELLTAIALIPVQTAWLGALGAFALFAAFAIGIAVNLARGQSPDCHCFGQLYSKPVTWSTFTRELLLMGVAGLIIVQGKNHAGLSAVAWMTRLSRGEKLNLVLGSTVVALLVTAVVYLRRVLSQHGTLLDRIEAVKKMVEEEYAEPIVERTEANAPLEGLPVGAPAPGFSVASIAGGQVTLDDLLAEGKSVLLLFVSPNCSPCKTLLPEVDGWERDHGGQLTVAVLSKGGPDETRKSMTHYGIRHLLLHAESRVADEYEAKWTPAAVLINPRGRIASRVNYGDEAIRTLVSQTSRAREVRAGSNEKSNGNRHRPSLEVGTSRLRVGDPAPNFLLPDIEGNVVKTEDLLGHDTLLLFWNPGCPWCQKLTTDLRGFEQHPPKRAARLVFISTGDSEKIRAMNRLFTSQQLYDSEMDTGALFGTSSTPSAVLIDEDGRIASGVATGPRDVLALAGVRKMELPVTSGFLAGTIETR
ncbi:MAG: redoxin domain-containing protein [Acidobacteria bacterium]|nr:redoxin domain-containing protein [Acidobacteriota bacterium]